MGDSNWFRLPRLYPILDTASLEGRGCAPEVFAAAVLEAGAEILQLRHKAPFTRRVFLLAERIGDLCKGAGARYILNDRCDIAAILGAGVHLGQDDLPPRHARQLLGPRAVTGYSTHNEPQMRAAAELPVSYLAIGPVFRTGTKENPDPVLGLDELRRLRPLTDKPLVAIGGITLENARSVLETGVDSVAVIGGLLPRDCTHSSIRALTEQWQHQLRP